MEKLSRLCRVCLTENIQHSIENTQFQAVYEKLAGMLLQTKNMRPLSVCFICYTQLNKARNLMVKCLKAEEILTQMQTQLLGTKKEVDHEATLHDILCLCSPQLSISVTEHNNIEPEVEDIDIKQELLYKQEAGTSQSSLTTAKNTDIKQETPFNQIDDRLSHLSISATEQTNIDSGSQHVNIKQEIEELDDEDESLISSSTTALSGVAGNIKKEIIEVVQTESLQSASKLEGINIKEEMVYGEDDAENTIHSPGTPVEEHPNIVLRITKSKIDNSTKQKNEQEYLHKRKKINVIYNCNVCQSNFKSISDLKEHTRIIHTAERFDTRDYKIIKKESCETVKPYSCDLCGKAFITKLGLERHIQAHNGVKPYPCDTCPARFSYRGNLYRHIVTHSGEKCFYCSVCYKKINRKGNLIKHLRVHIGERSSTSHLHPISLGQTNAKRYPCDICQKSFNKQSTLIEHIRTHTGERPYACDVCNKSFISKSKIKLHIRTHTGEKLYVCNICNKSFTENSKLRLHIRIHTGEKPYTCGVCQRSFNRKAHLKGHTRIHTGVTPYACKVCHKRYTDSSGLKRHYRISH